METTEPTQDPAWWSPYVWPSVVAALLGGHVLIVLGALVISATMNPAASVAPAGYAEALAWDEQQAARLESDRLGWTLQVTPGDKRDLRGDRLVTFTITDRDGVPVEGADFFITLYHHAHPGNPIAQQVPPSDGSPDYRAKLPLRHSGLWRLSALATHGGARFVSQSDLWIGDAKGAAR